MRTADKQSRMTDSDLSYVLASCVVMHAASRSKIFVQLAHILDRMPALFRLDRMDGMQNKIQNVCVKTYGGPCNDLVRNRGRTT